MRSKHGSIRLILVAALAAFAFAAVASSAMASVSIEPLSTKFNGASSGTVNFGLITAGETQFSPTCKKATLAGTTNSTKTNFINGTDGFTECTVGILSGKYALAVSNHCKTEGTIPWTVTFSEGGTASLKLNCALVIKFVSSFDECTITAPEQTPKSGVFWENVKSVNLDVTTKVSFSSLEFNSGCTENGIGSKSSTLTLSDALAINGIHAA